MCMSKVYLQYNIIHHRMTPGPLDLYVTLKSWNIQNCEHVKQKTKPILCKSKKQAEEHN